MTSHQGYRLNVEKMRAGRKLWRPRLPETLKERCASCPFREGNDEEFRIVVEKIVQAEKGHKTEPVYPLVGIMTRRAVRMDVSQRGDFACHLTAYDENMKQRPVSEHLQCPGAATYYRECQTP